MKSFLPAFLLFFASCFSSSIYAQDARWGHQLFFDGTNDYFRANSVSAEVAGSNWTIEFWFRPLRNVTYTEAILSFNPADGTNRIEIGVGPSTGNKMYIYTPNSSPTTLYGTTAISTSTWYHVAITFNASNRAIQMYLNGSGTAEVSRIVPANNVVLSTDLFSLGQEWDNANPSGFFYGQMDEVRVWSTIRSNTEINDNLYREIPVSSSGLVAYYKMTDNTGTTVTDNTGNGNNGTLVGTAWQGASAPKPSYGTVSADQTINEGESPADITITNTPYANILWQQSSNNTDWSDVSGANAATLTGAQTGPLNAATYYRARLDNGYGVYDYGDTVMVTVQSASLPVRWLYFNAQKQDDNVLLTWGTAIEERVKHFEIQHSINGREWIPIGIKAATGNSSVTRQYDFVHETPLKGYNHYRIAEIDLDGNLSYSKVVSVSDAATRSSLLVYPNPVTAGTLHVRLEEASIVQLVNSQGIVVYRKNLSAGTHSLPVQHLSKGNYWLKTAGNQVQFMVQ